MHEILRVESGSKAYGTNIPGQEDRDELSIVVETKSQVFDLNRQGLRTKMVRSQPEGVRSQPGDLDLTIYSLRSFIELAATGNPSILAALWAPVIASTPLGDELRANAHLFVGRHVIARYRGYMRQQGMRLLGLGGASQGGRGGTRRDELIEAHGYDTKYAMHAARLGFQCVELMMTHELELPMPNGWPRSWLLDLRQGKVPFDEWWTVCLTLDAEMDKLLTDNTIPKYPDRNAIVQLSIDLHEKAWNEEV